MSEQTISELINELGQFPNRFCDIPSNFDIKDEFLHGLSKRDFVKAFVMYRNIVADIYINVCEKPNDYGFVSIGRKTGDEKPSKQKTSSILYLISEK